jgi:hypothetical protein
MLPWKSFAPDLVMMSTVYWLALVVLERSTSTAPKMKNLFLMMGPPNVPPTSLRVNVGTVFSNSVRAESELFRK